MFTRLRGRLRASDKRRNRRRVQALEKVNQRADAVSTTARQRVGLSLNNVKKETHPLPQGGTDLITLPLECCKSL
jgi:hypothetical protein